MQAILTTKINRLRRETLSNILRVALIWAGVGTSVAAVICFTVVYGFAVFVIIDAAPGALVLGTIEALWLYAERSKAANSQEFIRFGCISGAGIGILALPPALACSGAQFTSWTFPVVFVVAALFGGGVAGGCSAAWSQTSADWRGSSHSMLRVVTGCCLVVVPLMLAEYYCCGQIVQSRLKVLAFLPKSFVTNLRVGSALGTGWTGCYSWNYRNVGESGAGGGRLKITQIDGHMAIETGYTDLPLEGGIDSTGHFWVGRDTTHGDLELRVLWKGKLSNHSRFSFSSRSTVLDNGNFSNSVLANGGGYSVPYP
jgi:hypothetical protein